MNFAFLQYSAVEFYFIPEGDIYNSRELLLALGWLFASNNVMEKKVKTNLVNSSLGQESSSQVSPQVRNFNVFPLRLENINRKI